MKLPRLFAAFLLVAGTSLFFPTAFAEGTIYNAPTNLQVELSGSFVKLQWEAPQGNTVLPERYAIAFNITTTQGYGIATGNGGDNNALRTKISIPVALFLQLAPAGTEWVFMIRADNDTLHLYSTWSNAITLIIGSNPLVVVQPAPSPTPSDTPTNSLAPLPSPSPTSSPAPSLAPNETPTPQVSPTETPSAIIDTNTALDTSTITSDTSTVVQEVPLTPVIPAPPVAPVPPPVIEPAPTPQPVVEVAPQPDNESIPESPIDAPPVETPPTDAPPADTPPIEEPPAPEPPAVEPPIQEPPAKEIPALIEDLPIAKPVDAPPTVVTNDSTPAEIAAIADNLIAEANGAPVTAQAIANAGLSFSDLPPQTPVEVRQDDEGNQVIVTAEVAAALLVLQDPAQLLNAVFNNPAQAILAITSIGADMSDQERSKSKKTIIASVIAGQAAISAAGVAAGSTRTSTGGGNAGGGAVGGNDANGVRRRKP
jgi:hypothetical protein